MTLDYHNTTISLEIFGNGKPIIFLHGFLENKEMWIPMIKNFKNYQIVVIDLLGHGKSGAISDIHTMEDQADMVDFVLNQLNITQSIFVGHSMGGYVALALLEKKPELFHTLLLQNSTTFSDSEERKNTRTRFNQLIDQNFEATVSMSIANLFASEFRTKNPELVKKTQNEALKTPVKGIKAAQEGMKIRKDTTNIWKNSLIKKYLILGKKDEILDYQITQTIAESNETFLLESGHQSHLEDYEVLMDIYQKIFLNY